MALEIFISGVSSEFAGLRDQLAKVLQSRRILPCWMGNLEQRTDSHTVQESLTKEIARVDGVICIVGFRYGAEPVQRMDDDPQRSYTQLEYGIAHELNKPVWTYLATSPQCADCSGASVLPEPPELQRLQQQHRDRVTQAGLFHSFDTPHDLCDMVGQLDIASQLGERTSAHAPFVPIDARFPEFRQPGDDITVVPRPSFDEFVNRLVHRPSAVDQILQALSISGLALVRGRSGCGKTTAVLHVAIETASRVPALYLDMGQLSSCEQAFSAITHSAMPGRLFIADNVHASEANAALLVRHWMDWRRGSHLLLLGWPPDPLRDRALAHWEGNAINVEISPEDLAGVYATLRRRLCPTGAHSPIPSDELLQQWSVEFGADLVMFQLALMAGRSNTTGIWKPRKQAVNGHVRENYLSCLAERDDLVSLALFGKTGLAVPDVCLPSGLPESRRRGMVRRTTVGRGHVRLQLWHPSLADRILDAQPPVDRETQYVSVAARSKFFAFYAAYRLRANGDPAIAQKILRSAIGHPVNLSEMLGESLTGAVTKLSFITEVGVLTWLDVATGMTNTTDLPEKVMSTPLPFLTDFLGFASGQGRPELRPVYDAVVSALVADAPKGDDSRLLKQAFEALPHSLANFLGFASAQGRPELHSVYRGVVSALVADAPKGDDSRLLKHAFEAPLHFLANFLGFASAQGRPELYSVYRAVVSALVADASKGDDSRLLKHAFEAPLPFLVNFLRFAQGRPELHSVYRAVVSALVTGARKGNDSRLLKQVLSTPLHELANFLRFAQGRSELRPVYDAVVSALVAEMHSGPANRLVHQASETPIEHLAAFLSFAQENEELASVGEKLAAAMESHAPALAAQVPVVEFWHVQPLLKTAPDLARKALSAVDRSAWTRAVPTHQSAKSLGALLANLSALGAADLARIAATEAAKVMDPAYWEDPLVGFIDISRAIYYADVSDAQKMLFARRVITPAWAQRLARDQKLQHLAGGLFDALARQPEHITDLFRSDALQSRTKAALRSLRTMRTEDASYALQLWAAIDLLQMPIEVRDIMWPGKAFVPILTEDVWPHPKQTAGIGDIQQQLWMGLKLLARHDPAPISASLQVIAETLERWRLTSQDQARTPAQRRWDASMLGWLERCHAGHSGRLVREAEPP